MICLCLFWLANCVAGITGGFCCRRAGSVELIESFEQGEAWCECTPPILEVDE